MVLVLVVLLSVRKSSAYPNIHRVPLDNGQNVEPDAPADSPGECRERHQSGNAKPCYSWCAQQKVIELGSKCLGTKATKHTVLQINMAGTLVKQVLFFKKHYKKNRQTLFLNTTSLAIVFFMFFIKL